MSNFNISISDDTVKKEFYKNTERFHVITCWIGIVLNIFWVASDYLVIPNAFVSFLLFRFSVSASSLILLLFRKQIGVTIYFCMFFLVLGISIQNSYMWSVMDLDHMHQHTFAYMALFIGAGMLVLWEFYLSIILLVITIISNVIFYKLNSTLSLEEFLINGGLLTLTVAFFCVFLIRTRYKLTYNGIKSRLELAFSRDIIEKEHEIVISQKEEIEEKNREILSSIRYAKRIQSALLPPDEVLDEMFNEYFVYYQPKDIVSGDFYWVTKVKTTTGTEGDKYVNLIAVADCTGHGVPGAFMSLIGNNFLKQSAKDKAINTPAQALDFLNVNVIATLNQSVIDSPVRDGMDIVLVAIDFNKNELQFAGANNPIYIVRNKELIVIKADKHAIGSVSEVVKSFTNNNFKLEKGDNIYLFTDGYADQFGGKDGKKLKYKKFEDVLLQNVHLPMKEQKSILKTVFEDWKTGYEQTDDVCVVGIKIS